MRLIQVQICQSPRRQAVERMDARYPAQGCVRRQSAWT